ncbi:MAG: hypothetical protein CEE43_04450 [Promethearchaeota archaeon Loki_b32]|nr:MAG: hypothetical protein CEE43_04450 [Candidatus Lokiarchaeota archaeon Loki_b32]
MCKICSEDYSISSNDIKESLKTFIHAVANEFEIEKIILFGSYARGDYHENSDIDLIIVGNFEERFFDRIGNILELVPNNLNIEPLVYTNEEFDKMSENGNPFLLTVISEGLNLL